MLGRAYNFALGYVPEHERIVMCSGIRAEYEHINYVFWNTTGTRTRNYALQNTTGTRTRKLCVLEYEENTNA